MNDDFGPSRIPLCPCWGDRLPDGDICWNSTPECDKGDSDE